MAKEPTKITLEERAVAIVGDLLALMRDIDAAKSKRGAKDDGPEAPEGSDEREAPARGRGRGAKADKPAKAAKAEQTEKDPADMTVKEFRRYALDRLHVAVESFEAKSDKEYDAFIDKYIQPVLDADKVNAASELSEDGIEDLVKALDKFDSAPKNEEEEDQPRRRAAKDEEEEDRPRRRRA